MLKISASVTFLILTCCCSHAAFAQDGETKKAEIAIVNGRAEYLPHPIRSKTDACASGKVEIEVLIGKTGNVLSAKAVAGNPLLFRTARKAAAKAKFGVFYHPFPIKTRGILVFDFEPMKTCKSVLSRNNGWDGPVPIIGWEVCNNNAVVLPKPDYPASARAVRVSGSVAVQVLIDEDGNVEQARVASGHPLLRAASVKAALLAKFEPYLLNGRPAKVKGTLVYNFVPDH